MAFSISAVVLLAVLAYVLIKKGGLKAGHAIVCILLGFYLASSSVAPTITKAMASVAQVISGIKI
ncbi:hypothetical protein ACWEQC_21605 [Streptomyces shenzhenensis]|uniref:hypothetical protein n=1 Tax=Streptomyces shenzhenensis TaxID=943815 RepID=UPI00382BC21E